MQRNYSTFVVIECIFGVLKQCFHILLFPPHYPLDFQACIPAALCALQNFIQEIDHDEGAIHINQLTHLFLLTFMMTMAVALLQRMMMRQIQKLSYCRANIANEMWESYLNYMADAEIGSSHNDSS